MGSVQFGQYGSSHEVSLLETIAKRDQEIVDMKAQHSRQLKHLISQLLEIIDHFETALALVHQTEADSSVFSNLRRLYQEHLDLLAQYRIQPIVSIGKAFDPRCHEAVLREHKAGVPEYTIVRELRKGYIMGDTLLRPAKVAVAVAPEDNIIEI